MLFLVEVIQDSGGVAADPAVSPGTVVSGSTVVSPGTVVSGSTVVSGTSVNLVVGADSVERTR